MRFIKIKIAKWQVDRLNARIEAVHNKNVAKMKELSAKETALHQRQKYLEEGYCDTGNVSTEAYKTGIAKVNKALAKLDRTFTNTRDIADRKINSLHASMHIHRAYLEKETQHASS